MVPPSVFVKPKPYYGTIDALKKTMGEDKTPFADQLEHLLENKANDWALHYTLGRLYENGDSSEEVTLDKDFLKAAIFYRRALELASTDTQQSQTKEALKKLHDTAFSTENTLIAKTSNFFLISDRLTANTFACCYHCVVALEQQGHLKKLKTINPSQFEKLSAIDAAKKPTLFSSQP